MQRDDEFEAYVGAGPAGQDQLRGLDPEWLSETIGLIYDCALDPSRWHDVIGAICNRFSFASAVLGVAQPRQLMHEVRVNYCIDDEWLAAAATYLPDMVALQGGSTRIQTYPLDEPLVSSEILPAEQRLANPYYRDILMPRGLTDAILVALARESSLVGYLGLNRLESAGPIRTEELDGVRLITPHLRRAVTISNLFDLKAVEAKTFSSVIESMAGPVLLVDAHLQIVHANHAGEAMLATAGLLRSHRGQLKVPGSIAETALQAAVRLAGENEALLGQRGIGIPVKDKDGSPAVLHVLPLTRGEIRPGLVQRAVAAVFVVTGDAVAPAPSDAIATLYDLTPAETQIFASLCEGRSLDETAAGLGIAKSTARTHLLRVFAKTGCKRQAELIALGARLTLRV